jgi:sulfate transport system ATP-binding protein
MHDQPASPFVCGFVGETNRLQGEVRGGRFQAGHITAPAAGVADGKAVAFVRPYEFQFAKEGFNVHIQRITLQGPLAHVEAVTGDGQRLLILESRADAGAYAAGSTVQLEVAGAHIYPA